MQPTPRPGLTDLLNLSYPQPVTEYDTYEAAQAAVDYLADKQFPVENLSIVGSDLKLVERVLGRRTWGTVLGQGAVSGVGTGLLVGIMMGIFFAPSATALWAYLLVGLVLGVFIGLITAAIGYAVSGGKRDFNSIRQTVASKYQILAEHKVAAQAREMLAQMPGARAAQFE